MHLEWKMWDLKCFNVCAEVTMWTLWGNFWLLEVKAETERKRPEGGWFEAHGLEEQPEKRREKTESAVWGNVPFSSENCLFCQPHMLSFVLWCHGVFSILDITASLQRHTNTGTREGKKSDPSWPPFLIGGKILLQKPQNTFPIRWSYAHF